MKYITISCLGRFGRFGNQLFQYVFARAYADEVGAVLQTPYWVGQKIFGLNDPPIDRQLPATALDVVPWGQADIDLFGYFQFKKATSILSNRKIKKWLSFRKNWSDMFPPKKEYYIAAHLRGGDYKNIPSFVVLDSNLYLEACEKFGLDKEKIVWISEESPTINPNIDPELGFLPDFMKLVNAPVILRANSSFSWWAAQLSNAAVYSPIVDKLPRQFTKGNYPRFADVPNHDEFHIKD